MVSHMRNSSHSVYPRTPHCVVILGSSRTCFRYVFYAHSHSGVATGSSFSESTTSRVVSGLGHDILLSSECVFTLVAGRLTLDSVYQSDELVKLSTKEGGTNDSMETTNSSLPLGRGVLARL